MGFNAKKIVLKDGTECVLRSPNKNDATKMIEYLKITSDETDFMTRYPEEINLTVEEEIKILTEKLNSNDSLMIAAFINGDLAGNAAIYCDNNYLKLKHRASFGISIKEKYWNLGIGNTLIKEILTQCKLMGYEQVELGVFSDNYKARSIYKKHGFEEWGIIKNAFKLKNGTYRDEIIMGKIF